HDRADARTHEPDRMGRLQPLEIEHLPFIEDGEVDRLSGRVAQPLEVRLRLLPEIEARRDDVAEHEALDPELVLAVDLRDESGLLERRQQPERSRPRHARAGRQVGEREPRLAERERAEEVERFRGGVDGIAAHRDGLDGAFHWAKWYIAQ